MTGYFGSGENGIGFLETYNSKGKETVYLGTGNNEHGLLMVENNGTITTLNADGKQTSYLGTNDSGGGHLETQNADGQRTAYLGDRRLGIFNENDVTIGYFGSDDNNTGSAMLFDHNGEIGWEQTGEKSTGV